MKSVQFVTSNLVPNTALECIANQFMRKNEDKILKINPHKCLVCNHHYMQKVDFRMHIESVH